MTLNLNLRIEYLNNDLFLSLRKYCYKNLVCRFAEFPQSEFFISSAFRDNYSTGSFLVGRKYWFADFRHLSLFFLVCLMAFILTNRG